MTAPISLAYLLARGDHVTVKGGLLAVHPASGRPVPPEWLAQHRKRLVSEAANKAGTLALEYRGFTVGNYGKHRAGGITLQFVCMATGQELYAIFNAETTRQRTSKHGKAGAPLPKGQFRVGKGSAFYRFWKSTGLPMHRRSDFHEYMGNLARLTFTASITRGERLDASTLRPLALVLPDNSPTSLRQHPDKVPTRPPDKETPQTHTARSFQAEPATGQERHGNTVIRECGNTGSITPPELQTTEEWLADYGS